MVSHWHSYHVSVSWTGNRGEGTSGYRAYDRSHEVAAGPQPRPVSGARLRARGARPSPWGR